MRFTVNRKVIRQNESCIKVVIAGSDKGVGATHLSILLSNYYAEILGKKTAIIDLNKDNDYTLLREMCVPEDSHSLESYKINKVTYFPGMTKEKLASVFCENFNCVIMDMGCNYEKFYNEICMCDNKFFLCCVSTWKIPVSIDSLKKIHGEKTESKWKYVYSLGDMKTMKYLQTVINRKIYHIPITPNPFEIDRGQLSEIEKIIWEG